MEHPVLAGKHLLFCGDSISYGHYDACPGTAWAGRLAKDTGLIAHNVSQSGWTVSTVRDRQIVEQLDNAPEKTYDAIVLHGGVNDCWDAGPVGTVPEPHLPPEGYDRTTYAGGLSHLFAVTRQRFPGARVVFIINYPTVGIATDAEPYWQAALTICRDWQVPVLDLFHDRETAELLRVTEPDYIFDGVHPNAEGYDRLTPVIGRWLAAVL